MVKLSVSAGVSPAEPETALENALVTASVIANNDSSPCLACTRWT